MSNQKKYGLNYERKRKHELMDKGYNVSRCRGSFGLFDIIASSKDRWILESIKSTKQKYYSFRKEIQEIADFNNAPSDTIKRLVLYHKGKLIILYEGVIL